MRYVVVVIYVGGEAAAKNLVQTAETDLASVGDLINKVNTATDGAITLTQDSVTGDVSGGGSTPLNPEQDAKVALLRSGAANLQTGTVFYLTAVYTGTKGFAEAGVEITGACTCGGGRGSHAFVQTPVVHNTAAGPLCGCQHRCTCLVLCTHQSLASRTTADFLLLPCLCHLTPPPTPLQAPPSTQLVLSPALPSTLPPSRMLWALPPGPAPLARHPAGSASQWRHPTSSQVRGQQTCLVYPSTEDKTLDRELCLVPSHEMAVVAAAARAAATPAH